MIRPYLQHMPTIAPTAFVHADATVIGDVRLDDLASVWPACVLRGDQGSIHVGARSNIQDGSVVHATGGRSTTTVGDRVTVGHRAILHGCVVGNDCLVGMGAIVMDNAVIGDWCIVGAGALIPADKRIPEGSLVLGSPGRVIRAITEEERRWIVHSCDTYLRLSREHRSGHPG